MAAVYEGAAVKGSRDSSSIEEVIFGEGAVKLLELGGCEVEFGDLVSKMPYSAVWNSHPKK